MRPNFKPTLKSIRTGAVVFAAVCLGACSTTPLPATEAPQTAITKAEQDAQLPLTFRRTTLIVRDIDTSLALYRDAIGMSVIYDNVITRPHKTEDRMQNIRLVFLEASESFVGVLGLVDYEHSNPDHPSHTKPVVKDGFTPGHAVLLFNTNDMDSAWPKIEDAPGVDILNGPKATQYPSYDGSDIIKVEVTRFYDADGFLVEFNQLLDGLK